MKPFRVAKTLLVVAVVGVVGWLAFAPLRDWRRQETLKANLKAIGLALYSYHDRCGSFPPAYFTDAKGTPIHSWRTLILPDLGEQALYDAYNFAQPWDGPDNRRLADQTPLRYRDPFNPSHP